MWPVGRMQSVTNNRVLGGVDTWWGAQSAKRGRSQSAKPERMLTPPDSRTPDASQQLELGAAARSAPPGATQS